MGLTRIRADQISNIDYKQAVRVITVANVTLSGGAPNSVDGVSLNAGDRVLVTAQSPGSQNGIYVVTTVGTGSNGTWARSTDGNETGEIEAGMIIMVTEGDVYKDTQWKLITNNPIIIGTTALTFEQNTGVPTAIANGTSNVSVVSSGGNVAVGIGGTSNVAVFNTGGVNVTSNVQGGNLRTAGLVSATGSVYGLELYSTQSSGSEGGQINLSIPAASTSLLGSVTIDVYQNQLRFFQGDSAKGAYIDLTAAAAGVGTNLLAGGGGGTPGGANTDVQFNDGSVFGGNSQFTYNKVTNSLTVGNVVTTSNGAGTNLRVGDDAWIGDVNQINTIQITGQQNATDGYIIFGNGDTNKLGRSGTGPLTYDAAFSATGNITGGNLRTVGSISASGTVTGTTFVGIANQAKYADLAEYYIADVEYPVGTVLEFGGQNEVTQSTSNHATSIAGTVSDKPAYIMNSGLDHPFRTPVALMGRVPCRVVGTIRKGDRLVASDIPGIATVLDPQFYQPGCIIGKALEDYNSPEPGMIEVVVGRL